MAGETLTLMAVPLVLGLGLGLLTLISPDPWKHKLSDMPLRGKAHMAAIPSGGAAPSLAAACEGLFIPASMSCPRLLAAEYTEQGGFGHQFMEGLFAMAAARTFRLAYVYRPFKGSHHHNESYAAANELFGIAPALEELGAARWRAVEHLSPVVFDKQTAMRDRVLQNECGLLAVAVRWHHCSKDCFFSQENVGLFQRFGPCLQEAARTHGTLWHKCVFNNTRVGDGGGAVDTKQGGRAVIKVCMSVGPAQTQTDK